MYFLDIEPGLKIRSADKKTIDTILIDSKFKKKLKGNTARFFDLTTAKDLEGYIYECLGKPYYQNSMRWEGKDHELDEFFYISGFNFEM